MVVHYERFDNSTQVIARMDELVGVGIGFTFRSACEGEDGSRVYLVRWEESQMTNTERCSCGSREKNKCNKESEYKTGKMCLKEDNKAFDELTEKLWAEHPEEMAEAKIWAKEFIEDIKDGTR